MTSMSEALVGSARGHTGPLAERAVGRTRGRCDPSRTDMRKPLDRRLLLTVLFCLTVVQAIHAQGTWTPAAPLLVGRFLHAVAAGVDGTIYALGGRTGSEIIGDAEAYDSGSDRWSKIASLPTPRQGLAATVGPDGRIYAAGGFNAGPLAVVEAYDPGSNQWFEITPMPTPRHAAAAATGQDGRIYVIGGRAAEGPLNVVEAYDPATGTWMPAAPMPTPRFQLGAVTGSDGLIYAIGGNSVVAELDTVEAYDPSTDRWSSRAPMPTARHGPGVAAGPDGLIYALGGTVLGEAIVYSVVEAYDLASDSWTPVAPMLNARFAFGAAVAGDGRIYAVGGTTGSLTLESVEAYDVKALQLRVRGSGRWRDGQAEHTPECGTASFSHGRGADSGHGWRAEPDTARSGGGDLAPEIRKACARRMPSFNPDFRSTEPGQTRLGANDGSELNDQ